MSTLRARPLRRHLLLLTLLGLLPFAVFAALAIINAAQAHRAELARSTLDLSRAVATAVQVELESTLMSLASIARSPELQKDDVQAFEQRAAHVLELQPQWAALHLADARGQVLFRLQWPPQSAQVPLLDPDSMERTIRTSQATIGHAKRAADGRVSLAVRYPVLKNGQLRYVLSVVLPPDRLVSILERLRVPENWVIAVLDPDLHIFARSKSQDEYALRPATGPLAALIRRGGAEGSGITTVQEGPPVVTGFSRTPQFGWVVAVGAPTTPLANFFTPTLALYLAGAGSSLLICAVLALRMARRLTTDIGGAVDAATRLGEGVSPKLPASGIAEINRLARALGEAGERLAAAQAAQQAALDQAQEAGRAKDEFLAVLGHELRNPLAPMVSGLYLLDARCDASTARERAILRRQLDHMRRLVDDLLDVSRVTRGTVEIQREPVDVLAELGAVLEDLRQSRGAAASAITLESDLAQARVVGDARRLAQVFTNLLSNALRHGAGRPISVSVARSDAEICITVRDEGEGMTAQTLAQVFEPFYQSARPLDRPNAGLGLGLAIVRAIVQAHGGSVHAESAGPGQGSRFVLVFPAL